MCIKGDIINAWVYILNEEEKRRKKETTGRFFCHLQMLVRYLIKHIVDFIYQTKLYVRTSFVK